MIPRHAKLVFKGLLFEIYHWQQKMFDGSFETFEAVKRKHRTVVIIPTVKNKIVVLRQKQPNTKWFYCTPSGRMDVPKESPKACALRELLEETGMKPESIKLWKKIIRNGKIQHTIYFFIARNCQVVTGQKLDAGEKIKVEYFSFDKFLKITDRPIRHIEESLWDMFRARLNKKYRGNFKKVIFG